MSSDEKVLDFPRVEVTPEENARRVTGRGDAPSQSSAGRVAAVDQPER
jgi:hypothetical protein